MKFYPGLHQPSDCRHFDRCFVSINRLKDRRSDFQVGEWIMDSGAFTQVNKGYSMGPDFCHIDNGYFMTVEEYAAHIARWSRCGHLVAACTQDFMCEDFMFEHNLDPETGEPWSWQDRYMADDLCRGASIEEHQHMTVERCARIRSALHDIGCDTWLMPVLQGYEPEDYVRCIDLYETKYGDRGAEILVPEGAYVGVGSVCKRNVNPETVIEVLSAIKKRRPDFRLHGFGIKVTALEDPGVRALLESADSMAWSTAARHARNRAKKLGQDWEALPSANDWRAAKTYEDQVKALINQSN